MKTAAKDIAKQIAVARSSSGPRHSICTLVTDFDRYNMMVASFVSNGFSEDMNEYIYVDNSEGNELDAFEAIRLFLTNALGDFVILCHQDIELLEDGVAKLNELIEEVGRIDPNWAILGNSGGVSFGEWSIRISDPHGEDVRLGPMPRKVVSLDENFLLVRRAANLGPTAGMTGFHLYGADLCLRAIEAGYGCYVIDFHLRHASGGSPDATFRAARDQYIRTITSRDVPIWIQTTCTGYTISRSPIVRFLLNNAFTERLSRRIARIRLNRSLK